MQKRRMSTSPVPDYTNNDDRSFYASWSLLGNIYGVKLIVSRYRWNDTEQWYLKEETDDVNVRVPITEEEAWEYLYPVRMIRENLAYHGHMGGHLDPHKEVRDYLDKEAN